MIRIKIFLNKMFKFVLQGFFLVIIFFILEKYVKLSSLGNDSLKRTRNLLMD